MNPDSTELPPLENILVAALYLATNFAKSGCPRLSHLIMHQLEFVLSHPPESVSPPVRETCQRFARSVGANPRRAHLCTQGGRGTGGYQARALKRVFFYKNILQLASKETSGR